MRILVVSNLYPPHYLGGYELRCAQIVEALAARGHEIRVLTSDHRVAKFDESPRGRDHESDEPDEAGSPLVERRLCHFGLDAPPTGMLYSLPRIRRQAEDACIFAEVLREFRPDIVNWWNLEGLTKVILPIPGSNHIPEVHCVDDGWMIREYGRNAVNEYPNWYGFWQEGFGPGVLKILTRRLVQPWRGRLERKGIPTRPPGYVPQHVCFISEFRRYEHVASGLEFGTTEVIYGGVREESFRSQRAREDFSGDPLKVLYASFLEPTRGLHTVIEAIGLLPESLQGRIELTVVASGPATPNRYVAEVRSRIAELNLDDRVTFLGRLSHDQMPEVYKRHHLFLLVSTLPEGLPMTMLEAMSAGCAVLTTASGGAFELADRVGCPIVPKDHPPALSRWLARFIRSREDLHDLALRGPEVVRRDFTFERMVDRTASTLERVASASTP